MGPPGNRNSSTGIAIPDGQGMWSTAWDSVLLYDPAPVRETQKHKGTRTQRKPAPRKFERVFFVSLRLCVFVFFLTPAVLKQSRHRSRELRSRIRKLCPAGVITASSGFAG